MQKVFITMLKILQQEYAHYVECIRVWVQTTSSVKAFNRTPIQSKKNLLGALSTRSVKKVKLPKWECFPTYNIVKRTVRLCRNRTWIQNYGQINVRLAESIAMAVALLQGMVNSMFIQCLILTPPEHGSVCLVTQLFPLKIESHFGRGAECW